MRPNVLRGREGLQLSFDLPHRITDTCVYPRDLPNGSTLIICAHEQGLTIVWYAGRRLKRKTTPKVNVNSIDLTADDEEDIEDAVPEYEDEEQEIDPAQPFDQVLASREIPLGASVTKIAVPPLSQDFNDDALSLLDTHAIILAACADFSLRVLAVPLHLGTSSKGELQQVAINGINSHQDLISDVAITFTANASGQDVAARARTTDVDSGMTSVEKSVDWSLLLASTSSTGTGLLLTHHIPIDSRGRLSSSADDCVPVQRHFLRCPLAKCRLAFNSSMYPSYRHSHLLIASADGAPTKIYEALPTSTPVKKRRGSTATTSSIGSGNQLSRRSSSDGRILLDLLAPFEQPESSGSASSRKRVLDARWILQGRAILALFDDGEWGVWDIEAAGPTSSTSTANLVKAHSNISGIQGGAMAHFALKGKLDSINLTKSGGVTSAKPSSSGTLAPMTPKTRKVRSEGLFKGQTDTGSTNTTCLTRASQGSIAVVAQSNSSTNATTQDESIILNYGSTNTYVPSIRTYWRSAGTDGSGTARLTMLPQLQLSNESVLAVHHLPTANQQANNMFGAMKPMSNFLVATPSRFVLFVAPLVDILPNTQIATIGLGTSTGELPVQDQMLLDSGELDVDGMDRILDNMAGSDSVAAPKFTAPTNGFARKSVNFHMDDDDGDVDVGTPTISKGARSMLVVQDKSSRSDGAKRLFT